jgi:hypothetical protein
MVHAESEVTNMEINGGTAIGIALVIISLQFLFGALKESGRLKLPRRNKTFRQYPTFPVQGGEEGDF